MSETESDDVFHGDHYFEGVEKLMEIWFKKSPAALETGDLRNIPRECLEDLLEIVHCEVIRFSRNEKVDAYVLRVLLAFTVLPKKNYNYVKNTYSHVSQRAAYAMNHSESSMFVAERRFILKTCGTTTPLQGLKFLLALAEKYAGFTEVEEVFYSRKNFKKPDLQKPLHRSFDLEMDLLNAFFKGGVAYRMGKSEEDCWYLYTMTGTTKSITNYDFNININNNNYNNNNDDEIDKYSYSPDQTLELLMTDLDPSVMSVFTKEHSSSAAEATKKSGIDSIIPHMVIDDYLFEPCGYSMNGISKNGSYMTIHITPEPKFSYVSFETNVPQADYSQIIKRVLDIFRPGKVIMTLFANKDSVAADCPLLMKKEPKFKRFGELDCREMEYCQLRNYDLSFAFYSKFPS